MLISSSCKTGPYAWKNLIWHQSTHKSHFASTFTFNLVPRATGLSDNEESATDGPGALD